jgi:hypothetical protein
MPRRRTVAVTDAQRQDLHHHRGHARRPSVRERCAALLNIADGQSPHAVARHGLVKPRKPDPVESWLEWDERYGLRSVIWGHHGGAQRRSR